MALRFSWLASLQLMSKPCCWTKAPRYVGGSVKSFIVVMRHVHYMVSNNIVAITSISVITEKRYPNMHTLITNTLFRGNKYVNYPDSDENNHKLLGKSMTWNICGKDYTGHRLWYFRLSDPVIFRWYPAKRALSAMLTHCRIGPFGRIPDCYNE